MNILVFAVHPDDETLGCGGTILKHIESGYNVYWVIMTKGGQEQIQNAQITRVAKEYGFKKTYRLDFPTTKLHKVDFSEIIEAVSDVLNKVKPQIVYMNNRSDAHTDHQIAAKAVFSCTKAFRYPFIKKLMMYECISETDAAPNCPKRCLCLTYIAIYLRILTKSLR